MTNKHLQLYSFSSQRSKTIEGLQALKKIDLWIPIGASGL